MKVKYPKILLGGLALALVATISLAGCGPSAAELAAQQQAAALQTQNTLLQEQNSKLQDKLDKYTLPAPVVAPVYVPPPILLPPALVPSYPSIYPGRPYWYPGWHWPNWHWPGHPSPEYGPGPGSYHFGH